MFAGGGAAEGGGGEAGAGAGAGRGPGASTGASGGGSRKRRPHRAAASALAPSGGVLPAHAAPPQPVRVEREAGSPPPELKPKRKKAKLKSHGCTTGLWRRVPNDLDRSIDHAAIPAPQCTQKTQCSFKCCTAPGFSEADIMSFRELARVARGAGGKAGLDAFLLTYLQRKVKRAAGTGSSYNCRSSRTAMSRVGARTATPSRVLPSIADTHFANAHGAQRAWLSRILSQCLPTISSCHLSKMERLDARSVPRFSGPYFSCRRAKLRPFKRRR